MRLYINKMDNLESMKKFSRNVQSPKTKHRKKQKYEQINYYK